MFLALVACASPVGVELPSPSAPAPVVTPSPEPPTSSPDPATPSATPPESPADHVFPVRPPSAADYSQGHHDYPATDIFAPEGTAFVAVTDGVIDEVSREDRWDPEVDDPATRGGLFVSLIGDDGVRYYGAHLSSVEAGLEAGSRVASGDPLGRVGDSGNARGISPHLHFGISRPTRPGDWEVRRGEIDPFPFLEAWRRGRNRVPTVSP